MKTEKHDNIIDLYEPIKQDLIEKMEDEIGLGECSSDIHHYLCNLDFYSNTKTDAKEFLGKYAFDAIAIIQEYEMDQFGEVTTSLGCPKLVCNMFAYIVGEEILNSSPLLRDNWNEEMTKELYNGIKDEIKCSSLYEVYNSNH